MSGEASGDTVRAWLVDDRMPADRVAELFDVLDAEERRRADRKDTADGRHRFIVAHGAVRRIVGEHLGAPPADLVWRIGRHGKPELDEPWTGVRVNLSHSGGLCLIALSAAREVGVDVQRHVPGLDVVAMARRYFAAAEAEAVAGADDPADVFARLWARKEAVSKAAGGRLTQILPLPSAGPDLDALGTRSVARGAGLPGTASLPGAAVASDSLGLPGLLGAAGTAVAVGSPGTAGLPGAAGSAAIAGSVGAASLPGTAVTSGSLDFPGLLGTAGSPDPFGSLSALTHLASLGSGAVVETPTAAYRVMDLTVPAGFRAAVALAGREPFTVEPAQWRP